ncbi:hypothetical protein [Paracoccus zeaxanthinifaciens]|uniref:hypothetical protein n=1 Tax=Paracoccus zeaxanthinifaciens TaxID=187400 RepID=UPI0003B394A7|nr:hypothetical protein [Paracoccus zeaxanthinifaciens]
MNSHVLMGGAALIALGGCAAPFSRTPPLAIDSYPQAVVDQQQAQGYQPYPAQAAPAYGDPYAGTAYAQGAAPVAAPVQATPAAPAAASGIEGLEERKPDLCKAQTHRGAIGQPGSTIPSLGLDRSYRVVEYRGIEPQDYDPNRIVFRLDEAGNISNVDCG